MPPKPVRPLIDRLLDGKLDAILGEWKADGLSFAEMSYRLRSEHDITVSGETIRQWFAADAEVAS